MSNLIPMIESLLLTYGLSLLWAVVIFLIGRWLANLASNFVRSALGKAQVDDSIISFVSHLAYYGIIIFAVMAALNRLGIQTASFIAVLGAAGLAVGLALQGSLANFAAGVLILLFRPIKVGDYVEVAGAEGWVEEIHIFTTVLVARDNRTIIIPNAQITDGNITNYSVRGKYRLDLVFGIGYEDDLLKAKRLLEEIVAADERVFADPPPVVAVLELADSSVNFAVRPYVTIEDYTAVAFDITEQVKLTFDREGISIPFPQRDVHLFQE